MVHSKGKGMFYLIGDTNIVLFALCITIMGCSRQLDLNEEIAGLESDSWYARKESAINLGEIGSKGNTLVVKPLISALNDEHPEVRESIIIALGKANDIRAVEPLIKMLRDKNNQVRLAAAVVLKKLMHRINELNELGKTVDNSAVNTLIAMLEDENNEIQMVAIAVLKELKDPRIVDPLKAVLVKGDPEIRLEVLNNIGLIEESWVVDALLIGMNDEEKDVRLTAVRELWFRGSSRTIEPLIDIIENKEEDPDIRKEACRSLLTKKGNSAVIPLIKLLADENQDVRVYSIKLLGDIGDRRAVEPLINILNNMSIKYREVTARALCEIALDKDDKRTKSYLVNSFENYDCEVIKGAFSFYWLWGNKEHKIEALDRCGDKYMATTYLNCGNKRLAKAAMDWADRHGYRLSSEPNVPIFRRR
jgi:HEAT repeat protein